MYRVGERRKDRRRLAIRWGVGCVICIVLLIGAFNVLKSLLKPNSIVHQSAAITTAVNYKTMTIKYNEPDFTIDIPNTWTVVPRPVGPYKSFTWQKSDHGTNGQQIEVFEDVIPVNFAVNRVLVAVGNQDRLSTDSAASDNCLLFTKNERTAASMVGVAARWRGVSFWCDQDNTQRDVVGTSSSEGINTVTLVSPSGKGSHKFFFIYTNHSVNPDYSVFYTALSSFRMK
jgi:hypothetical protein